MASGILYPLKFLQRGGFLVFLNTDKRYYPPVEMPFMVIKGIGLNVCYPRLALLPPLYRDAVNLSHLYNIQYYHIYAKVSLVSQAGNQYPSQPLPFSRPRR